MHQAAQGQRPIAFEEGGAVELIGAQATHQRDGQPRLARRLSMKAITSPITPRRKASTHTTKMRPVTMVTDSPSVLNQSTLVSCAMKAPKSPTLFSSSTTTAEPTRGPLSVPKPP